jgi:putative (di)nucleoside polyphosphate hydrolase
MSTTRPEPTAYRPCVGLLVLNRQGHIWIGRRIEAKNDAEGSGDWWQMPQGGIDEGEDPARAALRELHEETGIRNAEIIAESAAWHHYDLPRHLIGKAWKGRYRGQKQRWFAVRFLGDDDEINITPDDHPVEFDKWRWAASDELLDCIVAFKRDVYREVLEEFSEVIRAM